MLMEVVPPHLIAVLAPMAVLTKNHIVVRMVPVLKTFSAVASTPVLAQQV